MTPQILTDTLVGSVVLAEGPEEQLCVCLKKGERPACLVRGAFELGPPMEPGHYVVHAGRFAGTSIPFPFMILAISEEHIMVWEHLMPHALMEIFDILVATWRKVDAAEHTRH